VNGASLDSINPSKWVLSAAPTAPCSLLAATANGEKRTRSTSLALAAETQIIAAAKIELHLNEITTHPSRERADLIENALD
jgi:hypothetical protein